MCTYGYVNIRDIQKESPTNWWIKSCEEEEEATKEVEEDEEVEWMEEEEAGEQDPPTMT